MFYWGLGIGIFIGTMMGVSLMAILPVNRIEHYYVGGKLGDGYEILDRPPEEEK